MVKFEYKVIKEFILYNDRQGIIKLAKTEHELKKGSLFAKNAFYVDYEFPEKDITLGAITKSLERKKYIKFIRKI